MSSDANTQEEGVKEEKGGGWVVVTMVEGHPAHLAKELCDQHPTGRDTESDPTRRGDEIVDKDLGAEV